MPGQCLIKFDRNLINVNHITRVYTRSGADKVLEVCFSDGKCIVIEGESAEVVAKILDVFIIRDGL